jgi:hypothetical protein
MTKDEKLAMLADWQTQIERTYNFDPHKVIAWLLKNGLIEMARTDEHTLSFFEPTPKEAT